jgi:hypothetical protein
VRLITCIVYTIIGFIACPFFAWITFFTSLPMMWKELWQRPKKKQELFSIDDMADAISESQKGEEYKVNPGDLVVFYGNKWGNS